MSSELSLSSGVPTVSAIGSDPNNLTWKANQEGGKKSLYIRPFTVRYTDSYPQVHNYLLWWLMQMETLVGFMEMFSLLLVCSLYLTPRTGANFAVIKGMTRVVFLQSHLLI